jgi:hypothetical protein
MSYLNSWQERTIANGVAIDVLDKQMLTANQSIAILQSGLTANDTAISTLQTSVSANTTAISSLQGLVSANITSISTINDSLSDIAQQIVDTENSSPKGVYATAAALTAALPTGDTTIYVVAANSHLYYWNGSAWIDSGVNRHIESMGLAKNGQTSSSQSISIKNVGKQKLLLHLHKRANNGYDTANDVYLPYANDNFSDVRIKTNTNEVLPYHMVYNGNIDIIPDKRLGINHNGLVFTNSSKNMITSIDSQISISSDNGFTWQVISALNISGAIVIHVTSDDVIFFGAWGILYRSESPYSSYTQVLDIRTGYTQNTILSHGMVEHPDGELFVSAYQYEKAIRIYKSTDSGLTWEQVYSLLGSYQHVHNMFLDINQTPVAIYAGLDGIGGVLKTTDKGATWTDLRVLYPNMPQSTDYGIIYSSADGEYRFLGGETAIVGGYSIIKTTDDANFDPVLEAGNPVYFIKDLNGKLIAGGVSSRCFKNSAIYISDDDGETWVEAYTTQPLTGTGASDGFRYISKDTYASTDYEQLIVGCQSLIVSPLRIISDENTYYAEVIVDVPDDCTELTVESGYLCANETLINNDFEIPNNKIISLELNENGGYINESISGQIIQGNFSYLNIGKHYSYNYPYIIKFTDNYSMKLSSFGSGIVVDISLSGLSAYTISFWARLSNTANFDIISSLARAGNDFINLNAGYGLYSTAKFGNLRSPVVLGTFSKYDIVVDVTNEIITAYENGQHAQQNTGNISTLLANLTSLTTVKLFKVYACDENDAIQHFNIYEGALSESDIYNGYNDSISDNQH